MSVCVCVKNYSNRGLANTKELEESFKKDLVGTQNMRVSVCACVYACECLCGCVGVSVYVCL